METVSDFYCVSSEGILWRIECGGKKPRKKETGLLCNAPPPPSTATECNIGHTLAILILYLMRVPNCTIDEDEAMSQNAFKAQ